MFPVQFLCIFLATNALLRYPALTQSDSSSGAAVGTRGGKWKVFLIWGEKSTWARRILEPVYLGNREVGDWEMGVVSVEIRRGKIAK
jgi:hypothetical protein